MRVSISDPQKQKRTIGVTYQIDLQRHFNRHFQNATPQEIVFSHGEMIPHIFTYGWSRTPFDTNLPSFRLSRFQDAVWSPRRIWDFRTFQKSHMGSYESRQQYFTIPEVLSSGFPYYHYYSQLGVFGHLESRRLSGKLADWSTHFTRKQHEQTSKQHESQHHHSPQVTEMLPRAKSMHPSSSNISM